VIVCPKCDTRNEDAARFCAKCGERLSIGLAQAKSPAKRRRRIGCRTVILIAILVLASSCACLSAAHFLYLRPQLEQYIVAVVDASVQRGIEVEDMGDLPQGCVEIEESDVNTPLGDFIQYYFAAYPIDQASVAFEQDLVRAELSMLGLSNTMEARVSAQNGRLLVGDVRIRGPMLLVVSPSAVVDLVTRHSNDILNQADVGILATQANPGKMVVCLSSE